MLRTTLFLLALCVASAAMAQDATQRVPMAPLPQPESDIDEPDYSRETLLRLFAEIPVEDDPEAPFRHSLGAIDFRALGMRWRVGYLPFFAPLQGSYLTTTREWVDPFIHTGTPYASPPRTWRRDRAMSAELRRLERRLRKNSSIVVKTQ